MNTDLDFENATSECFKLSSVLRTAVESWIIPPARHEENSRLAFSLTEHLTANALVIPPAMSLRGMFFSVSFSFSLSLSLSLVFWALSPFLSSLSLSLSLSLYTISPFLSRAILCPRSRKVVATLWLWHDLREDKRESIVVDYRNAGWESRVPERRGHVRDTELQTAYATR